MKIGHALKLARVRAGYQQKDLANRLDISANYLSMLENDKRDPSWSFICRHAKAVGIPIPMLLLLASDDASITSTDMLKSPIAKELFSLMTLFTPDEA